MKTIPIIVFVVCFFIGQQLANFWLFVQESNVRSLVPSLVGALPIKVQAPVDIIIQGEAP